MMRLLLDHETVLFLKTFHVIDCVMGVVEPETPNFMESPRCAQNEDDIGTADDPLYTPFGLSTMMFVVYTENKKPSEVAWLTKIDNTKAHFSINPQNKHLENERRYIKV